jgi:hypothetical protein
MLRELYIDVFYQYLVVFFTSKEKQMPEIISPDANDRQPCLDLITTIFIGKHIGLVHD